MRHMLIPLASVVLAIMSTDPVQAAAPSTSAPPAPALVSAAGIVAPNIVELSPLLVTAGQPTRESLLGLKAQGYDAVISLAPGDTPDAVPDQPQILKAQGVEFVHVPIPWDKPEGRHLDAVAAAMERLKGRKVLLHCQMNMRASAVAFLYRAVHQKQDPAAAWAQVKRLWTPKDQWAAFIDAELARGGVAFRRD